MRIAAIIAVPIAMVMFTVWIPDFADSPKIIETGISGIDGDEPNHNCRLWGAISNGLPDSILIKDLITYPNSLKILSSWFNTDGWGVASYRNLGDEPLLARSPIRASDDPDFDNLVLSLDSESCSIVMAHVRHCSQGCCCSGCDSIANPHPFWRHKNGRTWTFVHNGSVNKRILLDLIGEEYLSQNPPTGSGVPECDPSDTSKSNRLRAFLFIPS